MVDPMLQMNSLISPSGGIQTRKSLKTNSFVGFLMYILPLKAQKLERYLALHVDSQTHANLEGRMVVQVFQKTDCMNLSVGGHWFRLSASLQMVRRTRRPGGHRVLFAENYHDFDELAFEASRERGTQVRHACCTKCQLKLGIQPHSTHPSTRGSLRTLSFTP